MHEKKSLQLGSIIVALTVNTFSGAMSSILGKKLEPSWVIKTYTAP